jgi:hypothetical protein
MKHFIWTPVNLLSASVATSLTYADVRPRPGSVDDFGGPGTLIGATFLTAAFIVAGLWLARKIRIQE